MPSWTEAQSASLVKRKLIEKVFGWLKTVGLMRKLRHRGLRRVDWLFTLGGPMLSGTPAEL